MECNKKLNSSNYFNIKNLKKKKWKIDFEKFFDIKIYCRKRIRIAGNLELIRNEMNHI